MRGLRGIDSPRPGLTQAFVGSHRIGSRIPRLPSAPRGGFDLRKQYHFRPSDRGLLAWDVHRLIELSRDLPRERVDVSSIRELDEVYWFDEAYQRPTCRKVLEHMRLIEEVDPAWPIILSADGRVMDGMHRVARAVLEGRETIDAVRFERDPEPDHVGCDPAELPY